jgi:hypothetical protein
MSKESILAEMAELSKVRPWWAEEQTRYVISLSTGEAIREATDAEYAESVAAARLDSGVGAIRVPDCDFSVYVI